MIIFNGEANLQKLIHRQLNTFFLLKSGDEAILTIALSKSLTRVKKCFKECANKYYWDGGKSIFNPYHSGQYATFLYFLSNELWKSGNKLLADKVFYLNKTLNGFDLFYEVELPEVFYPDHPVGSVIGRASYGNYFVFSQGCTIGADPEAYPIFGEFVYMFANSTVIGYSKIGNNVFISAGTYIREEDIPDNTIVFGRSPNLVLKNRPIEYFHKLSPFKVHK